MSGYVTFLMGGRELAGRLGEVREVVRATGIDALDGARAPVTGLLVLRGSLAPAATTSVSYGTRRDEPSERPTSTSFAVVSKPVTSPSSTWALRCLRRIARNAGAMSPAGSNAVATW